MRNVKCRKVKYLDRCNFRKSTRIKSSQNVFKVFQYPRLIDPTTWIYFVTVWHYFCFKLCFLNSCYQKKKDGGMRRRVEAVIQARGGYTRYWSLNNSCLQVIHKWRFESEMTILSCFLNCEGQYLKWTCFTAKTGLVILWLNIH